MAILVGKGCFPGIIDDIAIAKTLHSDVPITLSIWQKIREFFCCTNQTEAMSYLHKLCHPEPETTKSDAKALFCKLSKLAYPGFEDHFSVDEYDGILNLCIMDDAGNSALVIRIGNDYSIENDYSVEWQIFIRYNYSYSP